MGRFLGLRLSDFNVFVALGIYILQVKDTDIAWISELI